VNPRSFHASTQGGVIGEVTVAGDKEAKAHADGVAGRDDGIGAASLGGCGLAVLELGDDDLPSTEEPIQRLASG
jgi:hypothetical protein